MASAKEQCFQDALEAWQDATGKDLNIDFEQPWTKDVNGAWERGNRTWWALVNSWRKTLRWLGGDAEEPGSVHGLRRPDMTMPGPNGKDMVVDLKFTDAQGNPDGWRAGQKEAYGDINKQNQGSDSGPIALDKNSCKCKPEGEPERETVEVPMASPFGVPVMPGVTQPFPGGVPGTAPGGIPGGVPAPASPPVMEPPPIFGEPTLVF